jgi:pimeloyl-ACP methyl ester carboxylesterase
MSTLFHILALIFAAAGGTVLLTCAIAWYEYANREPQLMEERFTGDRLWLAARLVLLESAALFVTILLHPAGWFRSREPEPEYGSGTPVLLLHGLIHNRACWLWTRYLLRRRGVVNVFTLDLPFWLDVETQTEVLSGKVEELLLASGAEKVRLVGHSMGGMVARHYLQTRDGAARVERCILLAAPNGGSKLAPFALTPTGQQLLPGSDFLQRLAEAPLPAGVKTTTIYSRHDNIVLPFENARLEGVENVELAGIGHISLLYHPLAFEAVYDALTEEQP